MLHQPRRFYTIIEVEKDAMESVFYILKELEKEVFLDPSEDVLSKYVTHAKEPIIITRLTTEAPIQIIEGVPTVTLEKMLVDIISDQLLFAAHQGIEIQQIIRAGLEKYTISTAKMQRYASRRNKKKEVESLINEVSNKRQ